MLVIRSESVTKTEEIGATVALFCAPGDVVILSGELGAGKTAFSRGVGVGLGALDPVTSPTFTIMREHECVNGQLLLHLDAYRLNGPLDVDDLGLTELLDSGAIAVIEWGERIVGALGGDYLTLNFAHQAVDDAPDDAPDDALDDVRAISLHATGNRWLEVLPALSSALQSWTVLRDLE